MKMEKRYDEIDKYLTGKMTPSEAMAFVESINSDIELAEAVELRREVIKGLKDAYYQDLKQRLVERDKRLNNSSNFSLVYKIAAGIAILSIVTFGIVQIASRDNLAKYDFYEAGIPNTMSESQKNIDFHKGMNAFKMERYEEAVNSFKPLLQNDPSNDTLNYYLGVSNYRLGDYQKAITHFEHVLEHEESNYFQRSEFRLALCLIKTKNHQATILLLENMMAIPSHPYADESSELIESFDIQ